MNKPAASNEQIIGGGQQAGGIADEMAKSFAPPTPGTNDGKQAMDQVDADFANKINTVLDQAPELNEQDNNQVPDRNAPADDSSKTDQDTPKSNDNEYAPAKEFDDFLQAQNNGESTSESDAGNKGEQTPAIQESNQSMEMLREIMQTHPELASQIKADAAAKGINLDAPNDSVTNQRLQGMESTIKELHDMITGDRSAIIDRSVFDTADNLYNDVTKDVPDYAKPLVNIFNNAFLRDVDLREIDRKSIEAPNKAVNSELDNYFEARAKAEGWVKTSNAPPNFNAQANLTPPNLNDNSQDRKPGDLPTSAFNDADRDFEAKVQNLFR